MTPGKDQDHHSVCLWGASPLPKIQRVKPGGDRLNGGEGESLTEFQSTYSFAAGPMREVWKLSSLAVRLAPPKKVQVRFLLVCRGLVGRELGSIPNDSGHSNAANSGEQ